MNKRLIAYVFVIAMLLSLCGCKQKDKENAEILNASESVETMDMGTVSTEPEPTETVAEIDREDAVHETEPAVNVGTLITADEKEKQEEESSQNKENEAQKESVPAETVPAENVGTVVEEKTEYEKLLEMSGDEQQKFMESFDSLPAFFEWLENAKAEYESKNPAIEIGSDGVINIG